MFRFLYSVALHTYAILSPPKVYLRKWTRGASARTLGSWFGKNLPEAKGPSVWFHAVSFGETRAVAPIVRRFKEEHPNTPVVFSTITETGYAEAKKQLPDVDHIIYLPMDLPWLMEKAVRKLRPRLLVLTETDFWYALQTAVRNRGGRVVVVNGKVSQRSADRYAKLPWLAKQILGTVDHFCLQESAYLERFEQIGIPAEKLQVTGNIKLDHPAVATNSEQLKGLLKLGDEPVLTIGSTHPPEEEQLLDAIGDIPAKILLVPRHPERFDQVAELLAKRGVPFGRYSEPEKITGDEKILLVDAMGVLTDCYSLSTVAIVAGSFTDRVGGHNIFEPLWFDVPVIVGPHLKNQPLMEELLLRRHAGLQVPIERVREAVLDLLDEPTRLRKSGQKLLAQVRGASEKTYQALVDNLGPC